MDVKLSLAAISSWLINLSTCRMFFFSDKKDKKLPSRPWRLSREIFIAFSLKRKIWWEFFFCFILKPMRRSYVTKTRHKSSISREIKNRNFALIRIHTWRLIMLQKKKFSGRQNTNLNLGERTEKRNSIILSPSPQRVRNFWSFLCWLLASFLFTRRMREIKTWNFFTFSFTCEFSLFSCIKSAQPWR